MSEFVFTGDILNVSTSKTNGNDTIEFTYDYEMNEGFWEKELIPFSVLVMETTIALIQKSARISGYIITLMETKRL